ncbi:MAG: hypothetical protein J6J71_02365 [Prevotella sp.]|nr:hypothetical protein [Prevotella sp.]
MRQQNNSMHMLMLTGAALMVAGAVLVMCAVLVMQEEHRTLTLAVAPWAFLTGTVVYVLVQRLQAKKSASLTVNRLLSIRFLSGICFIVSGLFMVEQYNGFLKPVVVSDISSYMLYMQIVHNNWVVLLLIGSLLQLYTSYRLSAEIKS